MNQSIITIKPINQSQDFKVGRGDGEVGARDSLKAVPLAGALGTAKLRCARSPNLLMKAGFEPAAQVSRAIQFSLFIYIYKHK